MNSDKVIKNFAKATNYINNNTSLRENEIAKTILKKLNLSD